MTKEKWYNFDGHKLIYHMDKVYTHFREGNKVYPLHIDIGATKACNAKCCYCYGIFQKMTGEMIPGDKLIQLFMDAPVFGVRSLTLTGDGEPTLNPAIYEAVTIGRECGLDIGFATNGIALNSEQMKTLLNTCTWVRFNLSAASRDAYKSIHGVDLWEKVQANIQEMTRLKRKLNSRCTLGLQMVLVPDAYPEIIREAQFAVIHGLDYFVIKQFSDPGCKEMSQFNLDWYDNPEVVETLKVAQSLSNDQTKIVPKFDMMHSKGIRSYDHCVDCALLFQVSGNGKCYPCGYLFGNEKFCYGDLKTQTLVDIIHSDKYWDIVGYMRNNFDVHTECKGCCRHDFTNKFIWDYLHPPEHINFI